MTRNKKSPRPSTADILQKVSTGISGFDEITGGGVPKADARKQEAEAANFSTSKRILLVEDHADTRNSLEFLLKRNNHEVKSAASVREALQVASQNTFDMVISDVGLPDGSGLDLMKQLHSKFGLPGIGLTGYGMQEDIEKSRAAGFVRHLTKPIRFEQLKNAINAL